jgi:hypothetical protein
MNQILQNTVEEGPSLRQAQNEYLSV